MGTFLYFSSISGSLGILLEHQFYDFIHLCHINDESSKHCNSKKIMEIAQNTLAVEKRYYGAEGFNEKIKSTLEKSSKSKFRRFEFIEVLVRLAHAKYFRETDSFSESINHLFHRNIEKNIMQEASRSFNPFREERLYTERVDGILKNNLSRIAKLFCLFGGSKAHNADSLYMTVDQFVGIMQNCSLISHEFNRRSAKNCAIWSLNLVIDDIKNYKRASSMTFTDFLECLCRAAEMYDIPLNNEIKLAGCKDIVEYYSKRRLKKESTRKILRRESLSRVDQIKYTLSHGESSTNLINGINVKKSAEDFPQRLQSFLNLLFHLAHNRLDKYRNYVGVHDWKLKKILMQYKSRSFQIRRDNRFTKKALKIDQAKAIFHGGKPKHPDIIAYKDNILHTHNLPS